MHFYFILLDYNLFGKTTNQFHNMFFAFWFVRFCVLLVLEFLTSYASPQAPLPPHALLEPAQHV